MPSVLRALSIRKVTMRNASSCTFMRSHSQCLHCSLRRLLQVFQIRLSLNVRNSVSYDELVRSANSIVDRVNAGTREYCIGLLLKMTSQTSSQRNLWARTKTYAQLAVFGEQRLKGVNSIRRNSSDRRLGDKYEGTKILWNN